MYHPIPRMRKKGKIHFFAILEYYFKLTIVLKSKYLIIKDRLIQESLMLNSLQVKRIERDLTSRSCL